MSAPKPGLDADDLRILEAYALGNNRELYFNYLAQKQGNDGYGLLALGVVRNDNAPGATANSFADRQARADGVHLDEGAWQAFGVDLMRRDLARRRYWNGEQRPDLALNLPVNDVQRVHDESFRAREIDPSAWTPYKLLVAARKHGGPDEAEAVWTMLLDNSRLGLDRSAETTALVLDRYRHLIADPEGYLQDMAAARLPHGVLPVSNLDPDNVSYNGRSYQHVDGRWTEQIGARANLPLGAVPLPGPVVPLGTREVTQPETLKALQDAREVRQNRAALREEFHPDDPNRDRPILRSPWLLGDAQEREPGPVAAERLPVSTDASAPGHPRHALWQQCCEGVRALDAEANKPWDAHSERMAASLTALAASSGLHRVDHVVLGVQGVGCGAGDNVFVVQGRLDDPAHLRAHMPTLTAINQPVAASFQQVRVCDQVQAEQLAQQRTQDEALQQGRGGLTMGG